MVMLILIFSNSFVSLFYAEKLMLASLIVINFYIGIGLPEIVHRMLMLLRLTQNRLGNFLTLKNTHAPVRDPKHDTTFIAHAQLL